MAIFPLTLLFIIGNTSITGLIMHILPWPIINKRQQANMMRQRKNMLSQSEKIYHRR